MGPSLTPRLRGILPGAMETITRKGVWDPPSYGGVCGFLRHTEGCEGPSLARSGVRALPHTQGCVQSSLTLSGVRALPPRPCVWGRLSRGARRAPCAGRARLLGRLLPRGGAAGPCPPVSRSAAMAGAARGGGNAVCRSRDPAVYRSRDPIRNLRLR